VVACVVLAAAQEAAAPGKHFAELRERLVKDTKSILRSDDWQQVAWGAYAAAEFRLTECVPDLRAKLQAVARSDHKERPFTALALLDALIQTDASVPSDELAPFTDELCLPSMLLVLGRNNWWRSRGLLLESIRQCANADLAWQACGNLLAVGRHPEFVLDLLRMPIVLRLTVCDAGNAADPLPPGDTTNCRFVYTPKSYPPIAQYVFALDCDTDTIMVAKGTPPIVARRQLAEPGRLLTQLDHCTVDDARATWLTTMLGTEHTAPACPLEQTGSIEWRDATVFIAAARGKLADVERQWQATVDACVATKLIGSDAAAQLHPPITLDVQDRRTDRSQPLPAVK